MFGLVMDWANDWLVGGLGPGLGP